MRLAAHGLRIFSTNWIVFAVQFVTGVIVIRLLGAEGKGVLALVTSAALLVAMLGQLGFPTAGLYLMQRERVRVRALVLRHLLLTAGVTALAAGLTLLARAWFVRTFLDGRTELEPLFWMALPLVPAHMVLGFAGVLLLARRESGGYASITLLSGIATLALTIALVAIGGMGVTGAVLATVLAHITAALIGLILLLRMTDAAEQLAPRRGEWLFGRMLRLGLPHHAGTIGAQAFKRADNFVIGYFLSAAPVGYYSVALTAYDAALSIPRALSGLVAGEAARRDAMAGARLVAATTRRALVVMIGVVIVGAVLARPLVPLVYGSDFIRAVPPLWILLAGVVLVGWTVLVQTWFVATGRMGISGGLTLLAGAVNFLASVWLVPRWGLIGCAAATLGAASLTAVVHALLFQRFSGEPVRSTIVSAVDVRNALRTGWRDVLRRQMAHFSRGDLR